MANATRSPSTFDRFVAAKFGGSGVASESLWARTVAGFHMVAHVGSLPLLIRGGEAARFFSIASPGATLQVTGILHGSPPRVGYAEIGAGSSRYAVYAESLLPASKRLKIPASSPFRQLNFAFYLGRTGPCRPARPRPSHREPTGRRVGHRHRGR